MNKQNKIMFKNIDQLKQNMILTSICILVMFIIIVVWIKLSLNINFYYSYISLNIFKSCNTNYNGLSKCGPKVIIFIILYCNFFFK